MEKGIAPGNNYLVNYIVSNTSKRIDFGKKNKVSTISLIGYAFYH
jgi:hypothetical protein